MSVARMPHTYNPSSFWGLLKSKPIPHATGTPTPPEAATGPTGGISRRSFFCAGALGSLCLMSLAACGTTQPSDAGSTTESGSATQSGEAATAGGVIRVGMEAAYAPYNWQTMEESEYTIPIENVDGAYADGYDVQIARLVADALGTEAVAVKLDFDGLIEALNAGQVDLIVAGMSATEERRQSIDFSEPYFEETYGLFVQQGSPFEGAATLAEFSGASVLGQKGTILDEVIDEIPGVNHLNPVDTEPDVLARLVQGTCDAATYVQQNEEGYLRANPSLVAIQFAEGDGFATTSPVNVGVRKDDADTLATVNSVLTDLSEVERQEIWNAACERQPQ